MSTSLVAVLLLSSFQFFRVEAYSLTIHPVHARITYLPQPVAFTCTANAPLTGCQFMWYNELGTGPLLDLSQGSRSLVNVSHLGIDITGYSYSGRGLGSGDCGILMHVDMYWTAMIVACRVRVGNGGWTYAGADLHATEEEYGIPYSLTTRETVVLPGGEARFMIKAHESLTTCFFLTPNRNKIFYERDQPSSGSSDRYHYLGGGLERGECGLRVTNVGEEDNGPFRGAIESINPPKDDTMFMVLIVARPPEEPTLRLVYENSGVTATCEVRGGRPLPIITWFLGNRKLRQDTKDQHAADAQDEWTWPWMRATVLQKYKIRRSANLDGLVLSCEVSHLTLAWPMVATHTISFTRPNDTV